MRKILLSLLFVIAIIFSVTGCTNSDQSINSSPQLETRKWDNTKYTAFPSSVGIDVYNEHSFNTDNKENPDSYKANRTLYISDLSRPITVMFNNNGKDRSFIMNVYYDYEPIQFRINTDGRYDKKYVFSLNDGYEIKLPLYLPPDLTMSGSHKLLATFCIGPEIHAKELDQVIDWYGSATIQDIIFNPQDMYFDNDKEYLKPENVVRVSYDYTLNQDYKFGILENGILPNPPVSFTVKPKEKFSLIYNVSPADKASQVLLLATIGFESASVDGVPYLLLEIPEGSTAVGTIELSAPEQPGKYEIVSYRICSPFVKFDGHDQAKFNVQASKRFTLEVKE